MTSDTIAVEGDPPSGKPLLQAVMRNGRRVADKEPLATIRRRVRTELECLPPSLRSLERSDPYRVEIAESLKRLAKAADDALTG